MQKFSPAFVFYTRSEDKARIRRTPTPTKLHPKRMRALEASLKKASGLLFALSALIALAALIL
jgi:hypothetical protein